VVNRVVAIENGVPDVPDGLVQFIQGVVDLAGPAVIADQRQHDLEIQSGAEDPADHDVVHALGNPIVVFGEVPDHFRRAAARAPAGTGPDHPAREPASVKEKTS
jgi:hypothetical protein